MIFSEIIEASATWTDVLVLSIVALGFLSLGVIYLIRSMQETFAIANIEANTEDTVDEAHIAIG